MLVERPAGPHVEQLEATADAEHGHGAGDGDVDEGELDAVTVGLRRIGVGLDSAP